MARSDDDTWDLSTNVGATATIVAVGRALANRGAQIDDPFAAPLVRAVGIDFFTKVVDGELDPTEIGDDDPMFGILGMRHVMAARTMLFDTFFLHSAQAGVRQAVILASGLDSRAYRLDWPAGTIVYEIDQRPVIDLKVATLTELGAKPATTHRPVAVDLRHDWPSALRAADFDPALPSVWSAEGLFVFLPPDAQDRLLDDITALSASGSRFASENATSGVDIETTWRPRMRAVVDRWRDHGFDGELNDLWYGGQRHDIAEYLDERGWDTTGITLSELYRVAGLDLPDFGGSVGGAAAGAAADFAAFVTARRR